MLGTTLRSLWNRGRWTLRRVSRGTRVRLSRRQCFILPTGYGVLFAAVLLVMLLGATNYNNNLGFMLTFLLASLGLVALVHTYYNLAGLVFGAAGAQPVFAGQNARFAVWLEDPSGHGRPHLQLEVPNQPPVSIDVPAMGQTWATLEVATVQRGTLPLGTITISTCFPLGLFRAWSYVQLETTCLVYPRPITAPWTGVAGGSTDGISPTAGTGGEDFRGLREYSPGDSPRRIHWQALARGQGLQTKLFTATAGEPLWLTWDGVPGPDTESRLGQLCYQILEADRTDRAYGLALAEQRLGPDRGEAHRCRCLEALARYPQGRAS